MKNTFVMVTWDNSTFEEFITMGNQTGGDFCGGLPPAERALLSGSNAKPREGHHEVIGGDTSHLSNARAVRHSPVPADSIRHGWHPNLNNPKGG